MKTGEMKYTIHQPIVKEKTHIIQMYVGREAKACKKNIFVPLCEHVLVMDIVRIWIHEQFDDLCREKFCIVSMRIMLETADVSQPTNDETLYWKTEWFFGIDFKNKWKLFCFEIVKYGKKESKFQAKFICLKL